MTARNAFDRQRAAVESGTVGETFIRSFRNAYHAAERAAKGYSTGQRAPNMTLADCAYILDLISERTPRIEPVQSAKGLEWLRSSKVQRKLEECQADIVADFDHFTLAGFYNVNGVTSNPLAFMVPMYTVHAKSGKRFTYSAASWQSGGMMDFHD